MPACIFCPNPRTTKRGEHVWDNWLNRQGGKDIKDPSTTSYFGRGGQLVRTHPSTRMDVTLPVVCDLCNNTWMSDLTGLIKDILEPTIRIGQPCHLNHVDILTVTSFAFLKSAVLDWSVVRTRRRACFSRTTCRAFRDSLTSGPVGSVALPSGLQVWIAHYRRRHRMEAQAFAEELIGKSDFKGYRILVVTYFVGAFMFQLTYPSWTKRTRNRPAAPFFETHGDRRSVPIWPGVRRASWPPPLHVDGRTLEAFRQRFRRVNIRRDD